MNVLTWIAAFVTGFLASLGTGGGMVLIIWLTAVMGMPQLEAQGINLMFFLPIAAFSVYMHRKNGIADIKELLPAMIPGAVFAAVGAMAAHFAGSLRLGKLFGLFLIAVGIKVLFSAKSERKG